MNIIYIYVYIHIYISIHTYIYIHIYTYQLLPTTSFLPCTFSNYWAIWPNDKTCFILILNLRKCFGQNQMRQYFSCSLTYQKIPSQDQLMLSAANYFTFFKWPNFLNGLSFQCLIKNLCITAVKSSFLNH